MHPEEIPTPELRPGQVGYIACNMKESSEGKINLVEHLSWAEDLLAHIGDTLHKVGALVEPMPGFKPAKAMVCAAPLSPLILVLKATQVYAGIYPVDSNDFHKLEESIKRVR